MGTFCFSRTWLKLNGFCLLLASVYSFAQPKSGEFYREYIWTTPDKPENSKFLRVGGISDYRKEPENYPDLRFYGNNIPLNLDIDLKNAIKAEITIEKVLCHPGTKNLRISVNGYEDIVFPGSLAIPEPQEFYTHQIYPTVDLPLNILRSGKENYFSLQVDTNIYWPQNLIYGVIFRIYYDSSYTKNMICLTVIGQDEEKISLGINGEDRNISSVDFIANYEGPDLDGDGIYNDWHYHYHRGKIINHVGTSYTEPFHVDWIVSWVPDQEDPVLLSARINFKDGLIWFLPETKLDLKRETYSVKLCKPEKVGREWLTREGVKQEEFVFNGDVEKITHAKMVFTSWSPGYLNGIYINDFVVFTREGDKYAFMQHEIPIEHIDVFSEGKNILSTGQTPMYHGKNVHGTEIMWPGIMVLIKSTKNK